MSKWSELQVLYLTTIGRVSGKPREIEIWFVESGGKLYILAEHFHKAQWVQNIAANPRVEVRIGGEEFRGTGRILDSERDREDWRMAQSLASEKYGWGEGLPVEVVLESGRGEKQGKRQTAKSKRQK